MLGFLRRMFKMTTGANSKRVQTSFQWSPELPSLSGWYWVQYSPPEMVPDIVWVEVRAEDGQTKRYVNVDGPEFIDLDLDELTPNGEGWNTFTPGVTLWLPRDDVQFR